MTEILDEQTTRARVEALLLAAEEPLSLDRFRDALPTASAEALHKVLRALELEYAGPHRGIHLVRMSGGYQLRTNPDPEIGQAIRKLFETRPVRISRAAMEALAIIAYRQPLTRAEIDEIRGVNSSGVLQTLQEVQLIEVVGRLDDIGKPNLYGTTPRFLDFFGLESIGELPTLEASELQALIEMHNQLEHPEADVDIDHAPDELASPSDDQE
ncbi:SMC-Scp complex subunit ScpB [Lujinxingia vulgaris]|uniref:SMC-Scp complex subunit ScpB n=1 Tax=Lujinxingia vulgaris TaxID=2600176 RepID=A0A5C6X8H3_9DELT|nr:SMC-Scp complex subunit ScpB [Lujinxingia vulgaris]TXD38182.1 SMC-Scp complex subunit ScpB [Lujinxingia vulgaris]